MGKRAPRRRPKWKELYGDPIELPDQLAAFIAAVRKVRNLDDLTTAEWYVISGIYRGLQQKTPEDVWNRDWARSKEFRLGLIQRGTPLLRALAKYGVIRTEMRKRWARLGFNAERERKRRAKDPEGYRKANTERQRRRRERLKLASQPQAPANDQHWDGQAAAE